MEYKDADKRHQALLMQAGGASPARRALRAAIEVHRPTLKRNGGAVCANCMNGDNHATYPCLTTNEITKELTA